MSFQTAFRNCHPTCNWLSRCFEGGPLPAGSCLGNLVNRKISPGGGSYNQLWSAISKGVTIPQYRFNKNKATHTSLKVGLGISRTNADSQWNPVYNAIHRIFVVETKRFVGSCVHVILTRQICGQRSSKAAESKRRALGNYFFERICYMFLMSKCRGDSDLGLCTTSGSAF